MSPRTGAAGQNDALMASALENVVTRAALLDLAGERYFKRGEGYHRGGHVRDTKSV